MQKERIGQEVHLKKRPVGSVKIEDFEIVKIEIPKISSVPFFTGNRLEETKGEILKILK